MAQNRDKLISIVAEKLDINPSIVREAVKLQHQMLKVTMQKNQQRTFYLRKTGFFQPTNLRKKLVVEKIERAKQNKSNNEDFEDPYEFN